MATREGDTLRFAGALVREAIAPLWRLALPLVAGARRFDLAQVPRIDSAGVAALAELAARTGNAVEVVDAPHEYAALCAAYRMTPTLAFAY